MKKVVILYDSIHGNTKKVAMLLTRGLEAGNIFVDCISIQNFDMKELINYDVIGVGVSSSLYGISKDLKLFLSRSKYYNLENKIGFIFETKTRKYLAGSIAIKIKRDLKKSKIKLINPNITYIVLNKESPLEDSNSRKIEQIGLSISEKLR